MSKKKDGNGWGEYQRLVLSNQERHDKALGDLTKQVQDLGTNLAEFKLGSEKEFSKVSRDMEGVKASLGNIRKSEKEISENTKDIGDLKVEMRELQVKSGVWGMVGGLISLIFLIFSSAVQDVVAGAVQYLKSK
jgi:head-tail adaptor